MTQAEEFREKFNKVTDDDFEALLGDCLADKDHRHAYDSSQCEDWMSHSMFSANMHKLHIFSDGSIFSEARIEPGLAGHCLDGDDARELLAELEEFGAI